MMEENAAFWEARRKYLEWALTPIGAAFLKFENAHARYWQNDMSETVSDRRLKELSEASNKAREEFLQLLRGW